MRKRPGAREIKEAYNERPVIKRSRVKDHKPEVGHIAKDTAAHTPGTPEWKKRRQIIWITAAAFLVLGMVVSFNHPWIGLLAGVLGGSMASVLAEIPRLDKLKFPRGLVAAWAGTALLFAFVLFLLIPVWHRQALSYAEKLEGVTGMVSEKVESDLNLTALASNVVEMAAEEDPEVLKDEEVTQFKQEMQEAQELIRSRANQLNEKTRQWINSFDRLIEKFRSLSGLIFFQSLLLGGGLLLVSWDLSQPVAEPPRRRKWYRRWADRSLDFSLKAMSWLGIFSLTRFAKGMVIGLLVSLGLLAGGFELAWFVGGLAAIFSFFMRPGYLLALLLAFMLVPDASNMYRALGGLLGTCILLFFIEKRMHWYVCLLPTLHAGFTPRVLKPKFNEDGEAVIPRHTFWGTVRKIRRISRAFSTLGAVVSICFMAWAVLPQYTQEKREREEIRNARLLIYSGNAPQALEQIEKLVEKYPQYPEVLYDQVKAQVEIGDYASALIAAESLAAWQPRSKLNLPLKETVYQRFRGFVFPDDENEFHGRGYEYIFNNGEVLENNSLLKEIGTRLLEIDEDNSVAYRALTHKALNELDADAAILHAEKGLEVDPSGTGWYVLKTQAHLLNLDWENVLVSCEQALKEDPGNIEMKKLRARARKARTAKPAPPR